MRGPPDGGGGKPGEGSICSGKRSRLLTAVGKSARPRMVLGGARLLDLIGHAVLVSAVRPLRIADPPPLAILRVVLDLPVLLLDGLRPVFPLGVMVGASPFLEVLTGGTRVPRSCQVWGRDRRHSPWQRPAPHRPPPQAVLEMSGGCHSSNEADPLRGQPTGRLGTDRSCHA